MEIIISAFHILSIIAVISVRLEVPQSGVPISLVLYRIEPGIYWEIPSGSCETDVLGQCAIQVTKDIRGPDGFLRGYLSANGIQRAVIWPGSEVEVVMSLSEPPHDNPYDYLATPDHPVLVKQESRKLSLISAVLTILAVLATFKAYQAARKQWKK